MTGLSVLMKKHVSYIFSDRLEVFLRTVQHGAGLSHDMLFLFSENLGTRDNKGVVKGTQREYI